MDRIIPSIAETGLDRQLTLRTLFDAVPVALMVVSQEARVLHANPHAEAMFAFGRLEMTGMALNALDAGKGGDGPRHAWMSEDRMGPLRSRSMEDGVRFTGCGRDGRSFPLELGVAEFELDGQQTFLLTLVDLSARKAVESRLVNLSLELAERTTDLEQRTVALQTEIEQRQKAEAELQRSHEDFRFLFQRNPLPMWLYSPATLRFMEVNDAALTRYGYTREEFLSMTVRDLHPQSQLERMEAVVKDAREREFLNTQNWKHRDKQGKVMEVDTFSRSMGAGATALRLVVTVDVTERNLAEAQLRQAQKMEAVGQLTGGIAHDFNNLLTIILGNLELLGECCGTTPELRGMVGDALASVHRGASLTQRLLAFARQQPLEPKLVDVAHMVTDMAGLMRRSLGELIYVQHYLAPDLWKTCVDPSQLENALLNLAVNARDAMPLGGRLTIEAQNTVLDAQAEPLPAEVVAGEYVQVAVSDSGTGIGPEVMEHILEPFFTTKAVGKGTGLGLSMVYGFVKQSGGHIKIYSEVGYGTTVKLYLPRATAGEGVTESSLVVTGMTPRSGAAEVILLVEDDATIRKLVERLLGTLGYTVLSAEDGPSALDVLSSATRLDLLFTDVVLPKGISGAALAAEAITRHPGLKVLYMSGYTRNALAHQQGADEGAHMLSKPFRKEELARAVHRVLHG